MHIVFDHDVDPVTGAVYATHYLDTSDPAVITMLTAVKATAVAQVAAGYSIMSKLPAYAGQTRWQAVLGEVVRLNDIGARTALGV